MLDTSYVIVYVRLREVCVNVQKGRSGSVSDDVARNRSARPRLELIEQLLGHIIRTEQTAGETALVAPSSTATPKVSQIVTPG